MTSHWSLCRISALWEAYMSCRRCWFSPNLPWSCGRGRGVDKIKVAYNPVQWCPWLVLATVPLGVTSEQTTQTCFLTHTGWRKKRGHHLIANIVKFHDRIAWKLVNFCNIICWTQSLTFCLKNPIALWRHLVLSFIHTVQTDLSIIQFGWLFHYSQWTRTSECSHTVIDYTLVSSDCNLFITLMIALQHCAIFLYNNVNSDVNELITRDILITIEWSFTARCSFFTKRFTDIWTDLPPNVAAVSSLLSFLANKFSHSCQF